MNNMNWLIRAARWAHRPPGMKRVLLVFGIVAAGLLLVGLEKLDLWPEWAQMERQRGPKLPR